MIYTDISTLTAALKEWAVVVEALEKAETIMLLRKGGIREEQNRFTIPTRRVWLYRTYEHQKPELLKPAYAAEVTSVPSGWHPTTVSIGSCAEISDVFTLTEAETLNSLYSYHVWTDAMVYSRLKWKQRQPLAVLLLRVYKLAQPVLLPYDDSYGGCKSWIHLRQPPADSRLTPVLSTSAYQQQVKEIAQLLH